MDDILNPEKALNFWEKLKMSVIDFLPKLLGALIIIGVGILIAFILVRIARKAMSRHHADPSLNSFVCKAIRIVVYILTLFSALSTLDISTTGLVAFFSASAAAIALALQDRLNDVLSGIVILFSKPFVTGDFIEFDKYRGYVRKIDILHTTIETYDRTSVIIPNSVISSSEVNNHTTDPIVRVQVKVPIPYEADINEVKKVLYGVLKNTDLLVHDESHVDTVNLEKFEDSSLDFSVRCFCDFKDYWTVYYSVIQGCKEALDRSGVTIPFNQLDVHVKKD